MKFLTTVTNACSDRTILQSLADYFSSRNEKSIELVDQLSYVIEHHDEVDYVRPDVTANLSIVLGEDVRGVNVDEFISAIESDYDEYSDSISHTVIKVQDVVDQISQSVSVNRLIITTIEVLASSAADTVAAITSGFWAKVSLLMGTVTSAVSSLASDLLSIITQTGKSVGDRVKDLMSYIGIYSVNTDPAVEIGLPDCRLADVTGSNVFQAWWGEAPQSISEFWNWLKETVKKIIQIVKSIVQVFLGSSVYRSLTKFFSTITLQADSFAINNGEGEDQSIYNAGFSWKYNAGYLPEIVPNSGLHECSNILNCSKVIYAMCANRGQPDTVDEDDIHSLLYAASERLQSIITFGYGPIFDVCKYEYQKSVHDGTAPSVPDWALSVLSSNPHVPTQSDTVLYIACWILLNTYGRLESNMPDLSPDQVTIYNILSYVTGSWLDYYHINAVDGLTDHLYTDSYVQIDLPCSSLYLWLVGNEIVCTRRVTPLGSFTSMSPLSTCNYFSTMLSDDRKSILMGKSIRQGKRSFLEFVDSCRQTTNQNISTDKEMMNAVFAANIADSFYLLALDSLKTAHLTLDADFNDGAYLPISSEFWPDDSFPPVPDATLISRACFFTGILTGLDFSVLYNLASSSSTDITNATLCRALGGDNSDYRIISSQSPFNDQGQWQRLFYPISLIIDSMNDSNIYFPYCHVSSIATGAYRVITDSELAHIMSTFLEVIAVVAATIYVAKKIKGLKRKALAMQTKADATSWAMVEAGTYDDAAIKQHYKMTKRAALCEKLSSALYGSVSKVVTSVGSAINSATSAFTSKVKSLITGGDTTGEEPVSLSTLQNQGEEVSSSIDALQRDNTDIKELIAGPVVNPNKQTK